MTRRYKTDDQYRDDATHSNPEVDILTQPAGDVPVTDPDGVVTTQTATLAAKAATVDLSATTAVTLEDDAVNITQVSYTPVTDITAPASGNSRVWTLKKGATTLATLTVNNGSSTVSHTTGVNFTLAGGGVNTGVTAGALTIESLHAGGAGLADPGGTLAVQLTL